MGNWILLAGKIEGKKKPVHWRIVQEREVGGKKFEAARQSNERSSIENRS